MSLTREDISYYCAPLYFACIGLIAKIGDAGFDDAVEKKVAWILGGVIAGLTPVVGPVLATGVQAALGRKNNNGGNQS